MSLTNRGGLVRAMQAGRTSAERAGIWAVNDPLFLLHKDYQRIVVALRVIADDAELRLMA